MLTDDTVNAMLDSITMNEVSLHTAYSAAGANEVVGGAYARKSIIMGAAAARARVSTDQPELDVPTGTTVRFTGLWTSGGAFRGMYANGGTEKGFQVDLANNRILCESHGLVNDEKVVFYGGVVPTGLVEGTIYFVVGVTAADPDYFQVSATLGGAAIDITGQPEAKCRLSKIVEESFSSNGFFTVTALTVSITE